MRHLFSIPLGQEIAPKAIPKNNPAMIPVIAAGVQAAGSMLSSGINAWSQSNANKANASLDKATRDWQTARDLVNYNRDVAFWKMNNEYNTPSAQRQRLQEAGYNPWISGSGGGMSNTSQVPSSRSQGSVPGHSTMMPVDYGQFATGISNSINTYLQASQVDANVANQNAQTVKTGVQAATEYLKATGDYKGSQAIIQRTIKSSGGSEKLMGDISKGINQDYLASKIANDYNSTKERLLTVYGEQRAKKELEILDKTSSKLDSEITQLTSQSNLNDQQIKESAERIKKIIADTTLSNESRDYLVNKLKYEVELLKADPMLSDWFATAAKASPLLKVFAGLVKFFIAPKK